MYIKGITLRNIRGFDTLSFDLTRADKTYSGLTVFTGDNGSGKSSLLKAIAVCLMGSDRIRAIQPSFRGWIRNGAEPEEASVMLDLVWCRDDDGLTTGGKLPSQVFPAMIQIVNGGKEPTLAAVIPPDKLKSYSTPARTIWSMESKGWVSCAYGPFRRVFGASPDAMRKMVGPTTERFVTLFEEAASLAEVDQWLRNLHHKSLEKKEDETAQLDLVLRILNEDLMPNQIVVDGVDSDGLWLKDRNGVRLSWNEMSDGYRASLALLADILRHLINAFGVQDLTATDKDGRLFVKRSAVVLIDELDAHLHPEWQRTIGFWLKSHFPAIQFLVTSHSPLVCQQADTNGIFVLPEPGSGEAPRPVTEEEYLKIIAGRADTVLRSAAFNLPNTRSEPVVQKREEFSKLKAKERAGGKLDASEKRRLAEIEPLVRVEEEI